MTTYEERVAELHKENLDRRARLRKVLDEFTWAETFEDLAELLADEIDEGCRNLGYDEYERLRESLSRFIDEAFYH